MAMIPRTLQYPAPRTAMIVQAAVPMVWNPWAIETPRATMPRTKKPRVRRPQRLRPGQMIRRTHPTKPSD